MLEHNMFLSHNIVLDCILSFQNICEDVPLIGSLHVGFKKNYVLNQINHFP